MTIKQALIQDAQQYIEEQKFLIKKATEKINEFKSGLGSMVKNQENITWLTNFIKNKENNIKVSENAIAKMKGLKNA